MTRLLSLAVAAVLASPALAGDLVVTTKKHDDAYSMMGQEQPAKDTTEVMWIGADRMRVDDGERVTLVRGDLKKMMILNLTAKTYSTIDLPLDMKKYLPAEAAPMMEQMASQMKTTVTPTTETKQIGTWNATRYTVSTTSPMGMNITQEIWATKDVSMNAAMQDMRATLMSANPMISSGMVNEMKKVEGFPVLTERTRSMMGSDAKSREEVVSIESKDAPEGTYDVPAGFTEKPFDPMADSPMGRGGRRGPRGG